MTEALTNHCWCVYIEKDQLKIRLFLMRQKVLKITKFIISKIVTAQTSKSITFVIYVPSNQLEHLTKMFGTYKSYLYYRMLLALLSEPNRTSEELEIKSIKVIYFNSETNVGFEP